MKAARGSLVRCLLRRLKSAVGLVSGPRLWPASRASANQTVRETDSRAMAARPEKGCRTAQGVADHKPAKGRA